MVESNVPRRFWKPTAAVLRKRFRASARVLPSMYVGSAARHPQPAELMAVRDRARTVAERTQEAIDHTGLATIPHAFLESTRWSAIR